MAKQRGELDATFAALADPTRRGILTQLSRGQSRVTDLARSYRMTLPSFSKHLRVLERAGLIIRSRVGREHRIRVDPSPIHGVRDWVSLYADVWQQQFDALDEYLSKTQKEMDESNRKEEKTK